MRETIGGRGVLEGAFALLEALNEHGGRAGLTQLVRATGLPKTTVHRLLDQLTDLGAVERAGHGYRIGSRVFRLGRFWQPELRELAKEWLPALSARMRVSLVLAVPREGRALVVAGAVLPPDDVPVRPGGPLPPGTAAGRLLAAHHPALAEPDADAVEIRAAGYAAESETITAGLGCAAVGIRTPDGRVGAALAAVLPARRDPVSTVSGLASTARSFSSALAEFSRSNRAG
ncbi:IclR family transcriptional regulator [Amycolatopsis regifaucium]|uniref:Glycerol operon regulatory protein n=1 Tax=Amycolatopsis regifaucium TaxID=546365 RepID=A0A154M442_9PSEU|nr:helix-turn-helix domain-containing protein [Amycolatopsis regifaucium]KZB79391.1 transcriptional regulator, IclR family protein [Amycolatopsis regifaucium]OKA07573.1 transcriptional regulator, IclR family protein [Amycolatopsis regifaucium]SFH08016.1 DNA-binding transcriptional regulator, IclR family [Amycolatopsis regifaucium]